MSLSCFSILIHSDRNKGRKGSLNVPGLTDSFLLELTECVQRRHTAKVVAQWTLQENNRSTDLQMPPSLCSAYFPCCLLSVPLRIILLLFSSIHILSFYVCIILIFYLYFLLLHIFPLTIIITPVCSLSLFCAGCAQNFKKIITSLVISVRLSVCLSAGNNLLPTGGRLWNLIFQDFFENLSRKFRCHYNVTRMTGYCT